MYKPWRPKGYFQFEIITNVLVSFSASFEYVMDRYIYGQYKFYILLAGGDRLQTSESDVFRRQILTYKDGPRADRVISQRHAENMYIGRSYFTVIVTRYLTVIATPTVTTSLQTKPSDKRCSRFVKLDCLMD